MAAGRQRVADGHPAPYELKLIELGNEQYKGQFVEQVRLRLRSRSRSSSTTANSLSRCAFDDLGWARMASDDLRWALMTTDDL